MSKNQKKAINKSAPSNPLPPAKKAITEINADSFIRHIQNGNGYVEPFVFIRTKGKGIAPVGVVKDEAKVIEAFKGFHKVGKLRDDIRVAHKLLHSTYKPVQKVEKAASHG